MFIFSPRHLKVLCGHWGVSYTPHFLLHKPREVFKTKGAHLLLLGREGFFTIKTCCLSELRGLTKMKRCYSLSNLDFTFPLRFIHARMHTLFPIHAHKYAHTYTHSTQRKKETKKQNRKHTERIGGKRKVNINERKEKKRSRLWPINTVHYTVQNCPISSHNDP